MNPEIETQYADINQGPAERLFCASVTLILFYVHFFECVAGFVVSSLLFPTCLVFFAGKLVGPVSVGTHKRVLVILATYKARAVEEVHPGTPCLPQTWRWAAEFRFTACSNQSGIKLSCFAPFSQHCVMMRLASSL